jgi:hypothetical protein
MVCTSLNIISVIKLGKVRKAGQMAHMGERICEYEVLGVRNLRDETTWKT